MVLSKTSAGTLIATDGPSNVSMQIQAINFFMIMYINHKGERKDFHV